MNKSREKKERGLKKDNLKKKAEREQVPSVFSSPKAVSKGGPNKAVVSSEAAVC